jgi:hypothetical protein
VNKIEKLIRTIPSDKLAGVKSDNLYFWIVSHPLWDKGKPKKVRKKYKDIKRLVILKGWNVRWSKNQDVDRDEFGRKGTQRAFTYGVSRKKETIKQQETMF